MFTDTLSPAARTLLLLLIACVCIPVSRAQDRMLVDLDTFTPREVRMESFALDSRQTLHLEATGAKSTDNNNYFWDKLWQDDRPDYWPGNAWILDARTREVVWTLSDANTRRGSKDLRAFEGDVTLPAGVYEAYYASYAGTGMSSYYKDKPSEIADRIKSAVSEVFGRESREARRYGDRVYHGEFVENGAYRDFRLVVRGAGRPVEHDAIERERDAFNKTAFLSMTGLRDDAYEEAGFVLDRPLEVEVYAVGEARGDEAYDYGWILDADTRKKIWTFDYRDSDHAGGSDKNRVVRRTLRLPAGRYAAIVATDDSHAANEWNAAPAYDPAFWGLTLRAKNAADRARIKPFTYEHVPEKDAFVRLAGQGDDAFASRGFTLKRRMPVRIYALGEGRSGDMFDYGWIVDAKTGRAVWQMDYRDTEHAGGAGKNRLFDEDITLDAGDYIAYYVTDDSHAYGDWNSAPPIGGAHWGLTLLPGVEGFDRSRVSTFDARDNPNILAQIAPVRDDARERLRFTLDRDTRVRIYALGEGSGGDLYDYGWIEAEDSHRPVWEMRYRDTEHAGGAQKNRLAEETLRLPAGDYVLYYKTDDSHAFGDWNSAPPANPLHWGITLYRANE